MPQTFLLLTTLSDHSKIPKSIRKCCFHGPLPSNRYFTGHITPRIVHYIDTLIKYSKYKWSRHEVIGFSWPPANLTMAVILYTTHHPPLQSNCMGVINYAMAMRVHWTEAWKCCGISRSCHFKWLEIINRQSTKKSLLSSSYGRLL